MSGIDILAVMGTCSDKMRSQICGEAFAAEDLDEARAAVAELIERERMAREALEGFRDGGPSGGQDFREWHQSYSGAVAKAHAYFARVKG